MTSTNKNLISNLYANHLNKHNTDSLAEVISSDYTDLTTGEKGFQVYVNGIKNLLTGFPDVKFEIQELIEEGDKVVARWKWNGTHKGFFAKTAATGRTVENVGVVVFTIRDNKVVSTWSLVDRLAVFNQICG